jgi:hypothetical protein
MSDKAPAWHSEDLGEIAPRILGELQEAKIIRGRPVVAVDADEVLVHFASHFAEYCKDRGNQFSLTEYSLDSALRGPDGEALTREQILPLIWGFIDEQTRWQRAIQGAASAMASLGKDAQVVVLTNAPFKVRDQRIANLADHGISFPVVMNEGGKGRALHWLQDQADAPVAFVDDSPKQIASAAKHAPDVARFHLVGCEMLKPIVAKSDDATHHPHDWAEAEAEIRDHLL